uniref:Uncharacterized protein n=1 Tax=Cacopsylla melanoneura TaxID=428564 RepID=A0A8D8LZW6_9HEMI
MPLWRKKVQDSIFYQKIVLTNLTMLFYKVQPYRKLVLAMISYKKTVLAALPCWEIVRTMALYRKIVVAVLAYWEIVRKMTLYRKIVLAPLHCPEIVPTMGSYRKTVQSAIRNMVPTLLSHRKTVQALLTCPNYILLHILSSYQSMLLKTSYRKMAQPMLLYRKISPTLNLPRRLIFKDPNLKITRL